MALDLLYRPRDEQPVTPARRVRIAGRICDAGAPHREVLLMASEECQPDEIRVYQDGALWRVAHHNEFADGFRTVDKAVAHALRIFRERRHQRRHIVVLPATNPLMWD